MRLLKRNDSGYLLPATLMLGVIVSIVSVTFMRATADSNTVLSNQNYESIAQEAADSGIAYANSCIRVGVDTTTWSNTHRPNSNCDESNPDAGLINVAVANDGSWRSTFTVTPPTVASGGTAATGPYKVVSTGIVEILSGSTVVDTIKKTKIMNFEKGAASRPTSTGESITDIKSEATDCAIANGKLYCWGDNTWGQLGRGYNGNNSANGTPTAVGGALAGKTVTFVSVAYSTVCAIADGSPYCWGDDAFGQLGDGNRGGTRNIPTANVPITSTGALSGKIVTEIGTASQNNPANVIWPYSRADPHSCALTQDGAMACWGDGDFRQLTGGGIVPTINWVCDPIFQLICWPVPGLYYDYPSHDEPRYVKGYRDNTGPFAGKKALRIGASSHDSCLMAEGRAYCMGVPAPLNPLCYIPPVGLFSGASDTLIWAPFNVCIGSYSDGYDVSDIQDIFGGYTMDGKFLDPATWEVSANEGCWMVNKEWVCFGTTPAFTALWFDAWGTPRITGIDLNNPPANVPGVADKADVTNHDNGDNVLSWGVLGLYCAIDRGVPGCAANPLNGSVGRAGGAMSTAYKTFWPLGVGGGLTRDKSATKIGAGNDHGCVVANGQLYCWGRDDSGALADGNPNGNFYNEATFTGAGAVGTDPTDGAIAAEGSVSSGDNHSCAIVNGDVMCWGDNQYGQLGTGNLADTSRPQALDFFDENFNAVTKVSAGGNHTCAIAYGDLYCWGQNNEGQLGIGNTTNQSTPQRVAAASGGAFNGKRITDVSVGETGTCAIADGQAYCWGKNNRRQTGNTSVAARLTTPAPVNAANSSPNTATNTLTGKAVTSISIGTEHACAAANADLYCWGANDNGATGRGSSYTTGESLPTRITGGTAGAPLGANNMAPSVTSVSAGKNFTCAIINAKASCWGDNTNGQLGRNYTGNTTPGSGSYAGISYATPAAINGAAGGYYATAVSAGGSSTSAGSHACAVLNGDSSVTNGNVYCWGYGAEGSVGDSSTSNRTSPVRVDYTGPLTDMLDRNAPAGKQLRVAVNVDAGASSSCAVANAVITCWGSGAEGKLGNGSTTQYSYPKKTADYLYRANFTTGPVF